jgi:hypothetical protein
MFGSSVVAVRVAVQEVPPLSLAVLRFGQGGLLLVVVLLLVGARELLRVKLHDLPLLILLGAVLFTVFPVTFNASLRLIEASRGVRHRPWLSWSTANRRCPHHRQQLRYSLLRQPRVAAACDSSGEGRGCWMPRPFFLPLFTLLPRRRRILRSPHSPGPSQGSVPRSDAALAAWVYAAIVSQRL